MSLNTQKRPSVIHTGCFELMHPVFPELVQPLHTLVLQVAFGVILQDRDMIPLPLGLFCCLDWGDPDWVSVVEGQEVGSIVVVSIHATVERHRAIWLHFTLTAMHPLKNMEICNQRRKTRQWSKGQTTRQWTEINLKEASLCGWSCQPVSESLSNIKENFYTVSDSCLSSEVIF